MLTIFRATSRISRLAVAAASRRNSHILSLARNDRFLVTYNTHAVPTFLSRQFSATAAQTNSENGEANTSEETTERTGRTKRRPQREPETLLDRFTRMNEQVNRYDRVQAAQLRTFLREAAKQEVLDDHIALFLLRCTGSLLKREPDTTRQALFQETWSLIKSKGVLNTSQYNAAMRVMIENKEQFDPANYLAEMEQSDSTKPNRVTYQVMVTKYCQDGNTEAAIKIINHMKTLGMSVNEYIFSALIKAFIKKGDNEQAQEVLKNMRAATLEPTDISFKAMLMAYAELGNLDAINKTLEDAKREEVIINANFIVELACTAVLSGHKDLLQPLLGKLPLQGRYNLTLSNCADQLVVQGHDEEAYTLITHMRPTQVQEPGQLGHGKSFIVAMIQADRPLKKILEIQERLNATGLNTDTVEDLLQYALDAGKTKLAVDLMDLVRKQGNNIVAEDIISLSNNFSKARNNEGLYEVAKEIMKTLEGDRQAISLYLNVVKKLVKTESLESILEEFQKLGISEEVMRVVIYAVKMVKGQLAEVLQQAKPSEIKPSILKADLLDIIKVIDGEPSLLIQLMEHISEGIPDQMADMHTVFLQKAMLSQFMSAAQVEQLMDLMVAQGLRIRGTMKEFIISAIHRKQATKQEKTSLQEKLQTLLELKAKPVQVFAKPEEMRQMAVEDLEKLYNDQKRRGVKTRATEKRLLIAHCRNGNVAEAERYHDSLKEQGFIFDAEVLRELLVLAAQYKQDLPEAERTLDLLETQYPDYQAYTNGMLQLARLYIKQNKLDAAIELLKSRAEKRKEYMDTTYRDNYLLLGRLQDMCADAVEICGPKSLRQLIPVFFEHGYIKENAFFLIQNMVSAYVVREDFDGALDAMEYVAKEYNRTPYFSAIFKHFIKQENPEKLQKAVDLCMMANTLDQFSVLHHLMVNFIECGKVKQARNIAETPGLRADMELLKKLCGQLASQNQLKELQDLVDVTRNLFGVDKEEMIFQVIRAYSIKRDWQKALDAYVSLEEEGITPRVRTQRYLANVLKSNEQPVPFQVPEVQQRSSAPGKTTGNQEILTAIEKEDLNVLLDIREKAQGESRHSVTAEIASLLIQSRKSQLLKKLVYELATLGEVESVTQISSLPLTQFIHKFCLQRILAAHIKRGTVESLLRDFEKDSQLFVNSSTTGNILDIATSKPDLLSKVEELAVKATAEPGTYKPLAHLLQASFLLHQDNSVAGLLQKYPEVKDNLEFQSLIRRAKADEGELRRLADFVREHLTTGKYKTVMSNLILLKVQEGDVEGALKYVAEAKQAGVEAENMWARPMLQLEDLLREQGKAIPWPEGTFKRDRRDVISSESSDCSSSSSDSSDDERPKNRRK